MYSILIMSAHSLFPATLKTGLDFYHYGQSNTPLFTTSHYQYPELLTADSHHLHVCPPPTSIGFSCLGYNKSALITSVQPSFIYPYLPVFLCQFWPIPLWSNSRQIYRTHRYQWSTATTLSQPLLIYHDHATKHADTSTLTTQPSLTASVTIYTPLPPTLIKLYLTHPLSCSIHPLFHQSKLTIQLDITSS